MVHALGVFEERFGAVIVQSWIVTAMMWLYPQYPVPRLSFRIYQRCTQEIIQRFAKRFPA
jgi:hypothetical protein